MFCSINPGQTQGHDLMTARDSDRSATGSIKGRLMVVSGPSGTGKSTVVKRLAGDPRVAPYVSISATTRTPRPGETHGVEYFFLSREEFEKLRSEGNLLESAEVHGNAYGTPSKPVLDQINQGGLVILEIDVQGAAQVKERMPEAVFVFIHAPDMATLEARLRGRGTDSESVIQKRLENARQEIAEAHWYDYQIINEFLDQTVNELVAHWTDLISQGA
jgi:guanylate kinase